MQAKLERALSVSLDSRAKDERSFTINLTGQGSRSVSLSYVVTAPIWKTSYRLMLPKTGDKTMLQGWAVLENMTGSDWDKVDLAIVSGNPVTYHQSLYESYFVQRPNKPVQVFGRVMPRADQGAVEMPDAEMAMGTVASAPMPSYRAAIPALPMPVFPAPAMQHLRHLISLVQNRRRGEMLGVAIGDFCGRAANSPGPDSYGIAIPRRRFCRPSGLPKSVQSG